MDEARRILNESSFPITAENDFEIENPIDASEPVNPIEHDLTEPFKIDPFGSI